MAGKRSNGEGYIKRLASGRWRGQVMDGYTNEGKKKTVSFSGETKAEVIDKIREFQMQRAQNIHIDRALTFREWGAVWYESYQNQVQPSTYCGYKYTLKILNKHFGEIKLVDILPLHINRMLAHLEKSGYSKSQRGKCRTMLIQIFDAAEDNGLLARNAARKSNPVKTVATLENADDKKDSFSDAEIAVLCSALPDDLMGHSIRLLLKTGMRIQELIALASEDIAPDGSTIDIHKAIKTVDGKPQLGPQKNKSSKRIIPVPKAARVHAVYLREHSRGRLIWSSSTTNPLYSVHSFRKKYYNTLKKLEPTVRLLSPHCCRHTYVTTLQAQGVPLETISCLIGHANTETTKQYLHIAFATLENAVEVLSRDEEDMQRNSLVKNECDECGVM